MSFLIYEGVIDHDRVLLGGAVHLPDNTKVYVLIPDIEQAQATGNADLQAAPPIQVEIGPVTHIYSPRLAHPEQAAEFELEIS